jgi:hypothetical protein
MSKRTKTYFDLRDAFALPGCPICRLKAEFTEQFLDGIIYEKVNDPGLRHKLRQARGFCSEHAQGLVRKGAALGVAIMMRDVLRQVLKALDEGHFQPLPALSMARLKEAAQPHRPRAATAALVATLVPQSPCPVCAHVAEMEEVYCGTFAENLLGEGGLLPLYRDSDGLCLPHFCQVLARVSRADVFQALVSVQRDLWARLEAQLSESIRKSDYRFSDEALGDEAGSWLRALAAMSGARLRHQD